MTTSTLTPPTNNDTLAEALRADLALITRVTHPYQSGPAAVARNHPALRDAGSPKPTDYAKPPGPPHPPPRKPPTGPPSSTPPPTP
jgi:hypothetical protein